MVGLPSTRALEMINRGLTCAQAMAEVFIKRGYDVVSGGTDNHLFLVSLIRQGLTGMIMAQLEAAFGGPGRVHEQRLAPDGKEVTVYGWGGQGAFFAMDFPAGATAGTKTSSGSSGDKDELASRYEEYVLILP